MSGAGKVPRRAEAASAGAALAVVVGLGGAGLLGAEPGEAAGGDSLPAFLVCVNTAPAERLRLLEGIGPRLSAAIVADREASGRFETLADLDRVPRIGPRTVLRIAPDVSIEP